MVEPPSLCVSRSFIVVPLAGGPCSKWFTGHDGNQLDRRRAAQQSRLAAVRQPQTAASAPDAKRPWPGRSAVMLSSRRALELVIERLVSCVGPGPRLRVEARAASSRISGARARTHPTCSHHAQRNAVLIACSASGLSRTHLGGGGSDVWCSIRPCWLCSHRWWCGNKRCMTSLQEHGMHILMRKSATTAWAAPRARFQVAVHAGATEHVEALGNDLPRQASVHSRGGAPTQHSPCP